MRVATAAKLFKSDMRFSLTSFSAEVFSLLLNAVTTDRLNMICVWNELNQMSNVMMEMHVRFLKIQKSLLPIQSLPNS